MGFYNFLLQKVIIDYKKRNQLLKNINNEEVMKYINSTSLKFIIKPYLFLRILNIKIFSLEKYLKNILILFQNEKI